MHCPFCRHPDSRVVDSRTSDDGATIRRRRQCPECGRRFSTAETASLSVLKRSGVSEPFSRAKVISGVRKACQGRPVTDDQLAMLAQRVEEDIRSSGQAEIEQTMIPCDKDNPRDAMINGVYYMQYDLDLATDHIHNFIYKDIHPDAEPEEESTQSVSSSASASASQSQRD